MELSSLKFYNVIVLGFAFMLMFTGFQTCGMVEQTVLKSYRNDSIVNGTVTYNGDGYTSLAIIYVVFAFANWLAPSVVSVLGNKFSMVAGGITYTLYLSSFIKPITATLYIGSVLIGFGAADKQRIPLYIGLTSVCALGTALLLILRSHPIQKLEVGDPEEDQPSEEEEETSDEAAMLNDSLDVTHRLSWKLFLTRDMMILSITFFYTGLELTFFSGVYSTCVGATERFGEDSDKLVGLTGIMIGVGEILGGALFGIFGKKTIRYGRDPIVLMGGAIHMVTFLLIFLNIPDLAPLNKTPDSAYITPNTYLAVACGFLLGFADACFNTQCYSIIGTSYPDNSAPAFALFKFEQSLAAAIGFAYSSHLVLKWQLLILVIFAVAGVVAFFVVERKVRSRAEPSGSSYRNI
uniref:UNC93-like protein MFSD11 n=1 Tax=Ciona savignyi TaxID=51511 RepID=H2YJY7_CIOSA